MFVSPRGTNRYEISEAFGVVSDEVADEWDNPGTKDCGDGSGLVDGDGLGNW